MNSCVLPIWHNDNDEFRKLRKEVFEEQTLYLNTEPQDVIDNIMLSLGKVNATEITIKDFIEYKKGLKQWANAAKTFSLDSVLDNLNRFKINYLKSADPNPDTLKAVNEELAKYNAIKDLRKEYDIKSSDVYLTSSDFKKELDYEMSGLVLFHKPSLMSIPTFMMQGAKKLKVGVNTFSNFKSFVSFSGRNSYARPVNMGTDVYSRADACVYDIQILANDLTEANVDHDAALSRIYDSVLSYYNSELSPNKNISEEDIDLVQNLAYKMTENGVANDKWTKNHFGSNKAGKSFKLFTSLTPQGLLQNISFDQSRPTTIFNEELQNVQTLTKSVVVSTKGAKTSKVYINKNILMEEISEHFKDTVPAMSNIDTKLIKAAAYAALEYRAYFNDKGRAMLKEKKNNYQYFADFYKQIGQEHKAVEFTKLLNDLGDVGPTYVPRVYNMNYFSVPIMEDLSKLYDVADTLTTKELSQNIKTIANKYELSEKDLTQLVLLNKGKKELHNALLDVVKKSFDSDTDLYKYIDQHKFNQKNSAFIVNMYKKITEDSDVVTWRNTEQRSETPPLHVPVKTNITEAAVRYTHAGLRSIHIERMKYQYKIHKEMADKDAFLDYAKGLNYNDNHVKTWDFLQKHLNNVAGETYITDVKFLQMIERHPALGKLTGFILKGTTKELPTKQDLGKKTNLVNRLMHAHYLGYSLASPIKNFVGSRKNLIVAGGFSALALTSESRKTVFPKIVNINGKDEDIADIAQKAGVVAYVDYINDVNESILRVEDEGKRKTFFEALDKFKNNLSLDGLWEFAKFSGNNFVDVYADIGKIAFEASEKRARLGSFTMHFNYGITTLGLTKENAIKYAQGNIALTDGIYDPSGKVLISNGLLGSLAFKYANYPVTKFSFLKNIVKQIDTQEEFRVFKGEDKIQTLANFLASDFPTAKLLRWFLSETVVGLLNWTARLISAKYAVDIYSIYGDEFLNAVWNLINGLFPDDDTDAETNINSIQQGLRSMPGYYPNLILTAASASVQQYMFHEKPIADMYQDDPTNFMFRSENYYIQALQNTLRPNILDPINPTKMSQDLPLYVVDRLGLIKIGYKKEAVKQADEDLKESIDELNPFTE